MACVVAFLGISGVGKTTFLKNAAHHCEFQHLTAGSLIAAARKDACVDRDTLRLANLDENQQLLVQGFHLSKAMNVQCIVLDGHAIIHDRDHIVVIPSTVFAKLDVGAVVHLENDPLTIAGNRAADVSRERPSLSVDILREHQNVSKQTAMNIAAELCIPFENVTHEETLKFAHLVQIFLNSCP